MDKSAKSAEKLHRVSFSFADVKKYFDSTQALPIVIGVVVILITLCKCDCGYVDHMVGLPVACYIIIFH